MKNLAAWLLESIDDCQQQIIEQTEMRLEELRIYQRINIQYTIALQNGYDLGHWYLKYGTKEGFKK